MEDSKRERLNAHAAARQGERECSTLERSTHADERSTYECNDDNSLKGPPVPTQPAFKKSAESSFKWGRMDGGDFVHATLSAYSEVVHWRRNVFLVPYRKVGGAFVRELTNLFLAFSQESALERIANQAAHVGLHSASAKATFHIKVQGSYESPGSTLESVAGWRHRWTNERGKDITTPSSAD